MLEHPWYGGPQDVLEEAAGDAPLGADYLLEDSADVSGYLAPLRYVLDEEAIERYRRVGRDANRAVSEAIDSLPNYTIGERQVAAAVAKACRKRVISTPVLMAASEERMSRYRPTGIPYCASGRTALAG